ncbi:MAG: threonine/serine dehydratase, partial [Pseudomonadales bacterium]
MNTLNNISCLAQNIIAAENRIRPYVKETPLEPSLVLGDGDTQVFLKLENLQYTGSFKLRGATNKLLSLNDADKAHGVVTASSGNHGAATAYAAQKLGVRVLVFAPEQASTTKIEAIKRLGAEVRLHGDDGVITERYARTYAVENGMPYISPYNDLDVVAGQGSVGVELTKQCADLDAVFIAVGGGGLISGTAAALKNVNPDVQVIACSPANSAVMIESLKAGEILDLASKPTFSDGTAGGVEENAVTFELCQQLVDDFVLVSEDEIKAALKSFLATQHLLIEGAAAVVLA